MFMFLERVLFRVRTEKTQGGRVNFVKYRINSVLPSVYKEFEGMHFSLKWAATEMLCMEKFGVARELSEGGRKVLAISQTRGKLAASSKNYDLLTNSAIKISCGLRILKVCTDETGESSVNDSRRVKKMIRKATEMCVLTLIDVLDVVSKKALRRYFKGEEAEAESWREVQVNAILLLQRYLRQGVEIGKGRDGGAGKEKKSFDALITSHGLNILKSIVNSNEAGMSLKTRINALHVLELCSDDVIFQQKVISNANSWIVWEAGKRGSNVNVEDESVVRVMDAVKRRKSSVVGAGGRLVDAVAIAGKAGAELSPAQKRWKKVVRTSFISGGFKFKKMDPLLLR